MIPLFTKHLPFDLQKKLISEYKQRKKEVVYLIKNYDYEGVSLQDLKTIEFLLALSVFYRRVIANIDSASSFTNFVFVNSEASVIKIGGYDLDQDEKRKITAIIIKFRSILKENNIQESQLNYDDMNTFIKEYKKYKQAFSD